MQNDGNPARCRSAYLCKMAKKCLKTTACLCLCAVLVFGSSYKRPVNAAAGAIVAVSGAVFVAGALATMGICAAVDCAVNGKTYGQACADIWDKYVTKPVQEAVQKTAQLVNTTRVTFHATKDFLRSCFDGACQEVPQATFWDNWATVDEAEKALQISYIPQAFFDGLEGYRNINLMSDFGFSYPDDPYHTAVVSYSDIEIQGRYYVESYYWETNNGKDHYRNYKGIRIDTYSEGYSWGTGGIACADGINMSWMNDFIPSGSYKVFSANWVNNTEKEIVFVDSNGRCFFSLDVGSEAVLPAPKQDVFNPADEKWYADGKSAMNTHVDDVIDGVQDRVGVLNPDTGETDIPVTVPNVGTADDPDVIGQTQSDVLGKDIADDTDRDKDRTTNKDRDTTAPKPSDIPDLSIPDMIISKFPFCLPWDLYNAVGTLNVEAAPPVVTVPCLVVPQLDINESITIDMSQFDGVAKVCRWGFSILWIIGLIFLTKKLIWK